MMLMGKGDYDGAEQLFLRELESSDCVLGKEHPDTLKTMNNYAIRLKFKDDYKGAELLFRRVLEVRERVLGKEHTDNLRSMNNLACLLWDKRDYKEAELLLRRALEGICENSCKMGGFHPHLKRMVGSYGNTLLKMGMNEVQVIQRLQDVLKPYGLNMDDIFAH